MPTEDEKLRLEFYWRMYNENATQARQHETLRGTVSTILASIGSGILALYGTFNVRFSGLLPMATGVTLIVLAIIGGLVSYKHYERNRLHVSVLRKLRNEIDAILSPIGGSISNSIRLGRKDHEVEYPLSTRKLRLHVLWIAIFGFYIVAGLVIVARAWF